MRDWVDDHYPLKDLIGFLKAQPEEVPFYSERERIEFLAQLTREFEDTEVVTILALTLLKIEAIKLSDDPFKQMKVDLLTQIQNYLGVFENRQERVRLDYKDTKLTPGKMYRDSETSCLYVQSDLNAVPLIRVDVQEDVSSYALTCFIPFEDGAGSAMIPFRIEKISDLLDYFLKKVQEGAWTGSKRNPLAEAITNIIGVILKRDADRLPYRDNELKVLLDLWTVVSVLSHGILKYRETSSDDEFSLSAISDALLWQLENAEQTFLQGIQALRDRVSDVAAALNRLTVVIEAQKEFGDNFFVGVDRGDLSVSDLLNALITQVWQLQPEWYDRYGPFMETFELEVVRAGSERVLRHREDYDVDWVLNPLDARRKQLYQLHVVTSALSRSSRPSTPGAYSAGTRTPCIFKDTAPSSLRHVPGIFPAPGLYVDTSAPRDRTAVCANSLKTPAVSPILAALGGGYRSGLSHTVPSRNLSP